MAPTGLWLIGARGSVATTAVTGLLALRSGVVPPVGCVSAQQEFRDVPLPEWDEIRVGGHDIVDTPLEKRAELLTDSGVIPHRVFEAVRPTLSEVEREIRPGYHPATHSGTQADAARTLTDDITAFARRHGLARVVVVNVSSTEPVFPDLPEHDDLGALEAAMAVPGRTVLPPSSVAAYAAVRAGCPFVDFTPSTGLRLPALRELARRGGIPYAGSDGKTGETLVRSTLAPLFTTRALTVRSWAGTNLLGGGDGLTLADSEHAGSKLASKGRGLSTLLGQEVTAPLHIDNVPDLGEQKIAWDHVSFEGFLGARMSMQFTWTGYDSSLAAPLVLDLTRFAAAAQAAGEAGPLAPLAFFFKDPMGSTEHRLAEQFATLSSWAGTL
ncbi:myo-inositol-1-phosphate synthase [Saccharomonospora piscinae]|uniref:Myo-inositol-1-phosphate synthase n=1 Tax=Saccharomonospora piscinae TaxID=687388 RepID=A0A1V8ZX41_SACPI|nr:inositol-3-phosphate synthase [Saccharomonospora piscinae]OQO89368.1 myo-inositol-1-phosphate synthase [Saccharomonospora piscinae]TLW91060.1 myo-inositol-1-phosphate synthase [Saccharomonospora piscinae]